MQLESLQSFRRMALHFQSIRQALENEELREDWET